MCDKKHSGISVHSCSAHSTYVSKAKCIALPMQKLNRFLFGIQAKIMVNKKLTRPFSIFLSLLVSYTDEISFHARFVRFPTYNFRENWIFLINWFHFRHSFDGLKEFDGYINRHKNQILIIHPHFSQLRARGYNNKNRNPTNVYSLSIFNFRSLFWIMLVECWSVAAIIEVCYCSFSTEFSETSKKHGATKLPFDTKDGNFTSGEYWSARKL